MSPGLEPWLANELRELGLEGKTSSGGVELRLSTEQLWQAHHETRLAEHIRVRLRSFQACHFSEFVKGIRRLPWHAYVDRNLDLDVRVACHRSRLWHSDAVAERTERTINEQLGISPSTTAGAGHDAQQTVYVRITGDRVQPSVDASGERLHRRGRRILTGRAPLRETLAAALIRILLRSTTGPVVSLWDPFCGSGGILLEWVESRLGIPAGRDRTFAFEHWPIHDAAQYAEWLSNRTPPRAEPALAFGSDIDRHALAAAQGNAEKLNHAGFVWHAGDFESFADAIPPGTAIVTNPPYGVRSLDRAAYGRLLRRFEDLVSARADLRPVVMLLPDPFQPWVPRLPWQRVAQFYNGGLAVQVVRLD